MAEMMTIRHKYSGFTMIEVLVSLLIVVLGLLGLAGLQARIQQSEFESYQRAQALVLLYDMVDRINTNRITARCFGNLTNASTGTPYLGTGGTVTLCTGYGAAADQAKANTSVAEWNSLLLGAAESLSGNQVGAMIGARGCVSYDATTELLDPSTGAVIPDTGIYTVAVAWQGTVDTFTPTVNCGNNLYGAESKRRVVSTTLRLGHLK